MAVIEKRTSTEGKASYRAKVRLKGFPPVTASFDRKTDAQKWAQRIEAEMRDDRYFGNNKARRHTVGDLIDLYLDDLEGRNPDRHKDVKRLMRWWKEEAGFVILADFTSEHVIKAQQKLRQTKRVRVRVAAESEFLSNSTINRHLVVMNTAMNFAVRTLKWIRHNPVADVEKLKEPPGRTRFLSNDEVTRLLENCRTSKNRYLFAIVIIALSTGVRRSEIARMRWSDVVPDMSRIILPKTKNGQIRPVFLSGIARDIIQKLFEEREPNDLLIFPSPNDPTRHIDYRSAFRYALEMSNIDNFNFHDLRHTCGSYLAMNSANAVEIAEVLGHKTLAMVKRYAHLSPNHVSNVVAKMTEAVLGHVEI